MLSMVKVEEIDNKVMLQKDDFERIVADVDSLIETVEILSDKEMMEQIRESEKQIKEGKVKEIQTKEDISALFG